MSVEYFQQQLLDAFNGSSDSAVQFTAQQAQQYTEMFKTGQISKEEYLQLIADLQSQAAINRNMDNLEAMEFLNVAMNGLLNIAQAV
jgi:hypothetical protein